MKKICQNIFWCKQTLGDSVWLVSVLWCFLVLFPYWQPFCHLPSHADFHIPSGQLFVFTVECLLPNGLTQQDCMCCLLSFRVRWVFWREMVRVQCYESGSVLSSWTSDGLPRTVMWFFKEHSLKQLYKKEIIFTASSLLYNFDIHPSQYG